MAEAPTAAATELLKGLGAVENEPAEAPEPETPPEGAEASPPEPGEQPDDSPAPSEPGEQPGVTDAQSLAKAAGISLDKLYKVVFKTDQGDITLGQMKDAAKGVQAIETREVKLRKDRSEFETTMQAMDQDIDLVLTLRADKFAPQELQQLQDLKAKHNRFHQQALLRIRPELAQEPALEAALTDINDLLNEYGFPPGFSNTLGMHQWVNLLLDITAQRNKLKAIESSEIKPKGQRRPAVSRAARKGTLEKIEADFKSGKITKEDRAGLILLAGIDKRKAS